MLSNPYGEEIAESFARLCTLRDDDVQLMRAVNHARGEARTHPPYVRHLSHELAGKEQWRCAEEQRLLLRLRTWETRVYADTTHARVAKAELDTHRFESATQQCDDRRSSTWFAADVKADPILRNIYLDCVCKAHAFCQSDLTSSPFAKLPCVHSLFVAPSVSSTCAVVGDYSMEMTGQQRVLNSHVKSDEDDTALCDVNMSSVHRSYFCSAHFMPVSSAFATQSVCSSNVMQEHANKVDRCATQTPHEGCYANVVRSLSAWRRHWCILFFLWMRAVELVATMRPCNEDALRRTRYTSLRVRDWVHVCSRAATQLIRQQRQRHDAQLQRMRTLAYDTCKVAPASSRH